MSNKKQAHHPGLRKLAYVSAIIGGGTVGIDYALWFDVNPTIGAILGSVISSIITNRLLVLQDDPGGKIREFFTAFGCVVGAVSGIYIGLTNHGGAEGFFGGLIGGGIVGMIAGQIVAALISLAAFALLFISRGPVGFFLRKIITPREDNTSSFNLDSVDLEWFRVQIIDLIDLLPWDWF